MAKQTVKPLGDRVLVKAVEETQDKSAGGIFLPESAQEKPNEGIVQAIGTGKRNDKGDEIPFSVKEGNRVVYSKYGGTKINIDGEEYIILREDDILAVLG